VTHHPLHLTAATGLECLAKWRQHPPHVLLLVACVQKPFHFAALLQAVHLGLAYCGHAEDAASRSPS